MVEKSKVNNGKTLLIIILAFFVLGSMFTYSSSFTFALKKDISPMYFLIKQTIFYIVGFGVMFVVSFVNYRYYRVSKLKFLIFILGIAILIWVLINGKEINGARRWIETPIGTIQPTEFAKAIFVVWFAATLDKMRIKGFKNEKVIMTTFFGLIIYVFLIYKQNDLSSSFHLMIIAAMMALLSQIEKRYIALVLICSMVFMVIAINGSDFRNKRITQYMDGMNRENHFVNGSDQTQQSAIGIGSGGLIGRGYGNGRQKYDYLPEIYTDFIFSVIAEEFGFIGSILLIFLYMTLLGVGLKIVRVTKTYFGKYLAFGIISLVTTQVLLNLYVATGMLPATGLPLPFVSTGGSSLIAILGLMGIMLNIDRDNRKEKKRSLRIVEPTVK